MGARTKRLLLWCAATDASFELARVGDRTVLAGRCIHCQRKLAIALDGTALGRETVEHIIPRTHGGTDALENLAIACSRCNQGKGVHLDPRRWEDETLQRVIATLQARRAERMRPPLAGLDLPPLREGSPSAAPDPDPGQARDRGPTGAGRKRRRGSRGRA